MQIFWSTFSKKGLKRLFGLFLKVLLDKEIFWQFNVLIVLSESLENQTDRSRKKGPQIFKIRCSSSETFIFTFISEIQVSDTRKNISKNLPKTGLRNSRSSLNNYSVRAAQKITIKLFVILKTALGLFFAIVNKFSEKQT